MDAATVGNRDTFGAGFLWRSLAPDQAAAIAQARASGVPASTLAREYGVSVRTIYRALRWAGQRWLWVTVDDWRAQYIVTDEGPVRMTRWLPA